MHTFTDKMVKTRKDHKCQGCMKNFPAGKQMRYIVNIWEGHFHYFYLCHKCDTCMRDIDDLDQDGFQPGEIPNYAIDCQNKGCNNYISIKDLTLLNDQDQNIYVCILSNNFVCLK